MKCPKVSLIGIVVLSLLVIVPTAKGQTGVYLFDAFSAANVMRKQYYDEINYWREYLSNESEDVGYFFTYIVTNAIERSSTAVQGEDIKECARDIAARSEDNIHNFAYAIRVTEIAAHELYSSVLQQLSEFNLKEKPMSEFYYLHGYIIAYAYSDLWTTHSEAMLSAYMRMLSDFFNLYEELTICVDQVV